MSKFAKKRVPLGGTKEFCGVRLDPDTVEAIDNRHGNRSEWMRDAILEKLAREDGSEVSRNHAINKDELITQQALKIAELENETKDAKERFNQIHGIIYCIGGPLNDNILGYTHKQMGNFQEIAELSPWTELK